MQSLTLITFIVPKEIAALKFCHAIQSPSHLVGQLANTGHYTDSHFSGESKRVMPINFSFIVLFRAVQKFCK